MRISILLNNALGIGGTVAAALTLASALARRHEVEVVSMFRRQDQPLLAVDPRIRFGALLDMRNRAISHSALRSGASELVPGQEEYFRQYSRLSDRCLESYASRSDIDVIVATRPSLAISLLKVGARAPVVVQMHHVMDRIPETVHDELAHYCMRASAVVPVSAAQTTMWQELIGPGGPLIKHIPNPVPPSPLPNADPSTRAAVAVGRLDPGKRFDFLITAFDKLTEKYGDWTLEVVGDGPDRDRLKGLRQQLARPNLVRLSGRSSHVYEHYARSSVLVSASEFESFGLTLIEGMTAGLAVLSSDCEIGPRELIQDESNGIKFAVNDGEALMDSLDRLLGSEGLRRRLAYEGQFKARLFDPRRVADEYNDVLRNL